MHIFKRPFFRLLQDFIDFMELCNEATKISRTQQDRSLGSTWGAPINLKSWSPQIMRICEDMSPLANGYGSQGFFFFFCRLVEIRPFFMQMFGIGKRHQCEWAMFQSLVDDFRWPESLGMINHKPPSEPSKNLWNPYGKIGSDKRKPGWWPSKQDWPHTQRRKSM